MPNPKLPPLILSDDERRMLESWTRRRTAAQALALRARIVLTCAETGESNTDVAQRMNLDRSTVATWRARFVRDRLDGLSDESRPGRPRTITDEQVEQIVVTTLETKPANATHWSTRSLAAQTGMTQSAVSRIWRAFGLTPHRVDTFKISEDPLLVDKVRDVVGLYLDRQHARWCCAWTKRRRSRHWTDPHRSCQCCPACPNGKASTTFGTALPTCSPLWKSRPAR